MSNPDSPLSLDDVQDQMEELKQIARSLLAQEGNAGSVMPTQLVNSALRRRKTKSKEWEELTWENRERFLKDAHSGMRRVLVSYARARKARAQVHAGSFETENVAALAKTGELDLDRLVIDARESTELAEAVDAALSELERLYPEQKLALIVECRIFERLNQADVARLVGVTERTVRTREKLAYTLLRRALRDFYKS